MELLNTERYLRSIKLLRDKIDRFHQYPFFLPAFRNLNSLEFHPQVTCIVGENGTGKSTLLEAIATAWGFNPEGGTRNFTFATRDSHSELHEYIRLIRGTRKPRDGFFLIMGYPDAKIFQLSDSNIEVVEYEKTEHYIVTKEFMNNRQKMLKILLEPF